jgi:serine/threonine protein phosphatase 1
MESYLSRRGSQAGPPLPPEHLLFFDRLVTRYESATHYFAHAGMRPGVPLERQKEEDLLWIREDFIDSRHDFGKPVVFGHTAFAEPLVQPNKIGIDTGAVYGNRLTCVRLPEMQFYQSASAGPGKGKTG